MKPIFFFIRCRHHFDAAPEETVMLYGEEHQFDLMSDLARLLSTIKPTCLIEFGHYGHSSAGTVGEAFFAGEEIHPDEEGGYIKFEGDDIYFLADTYEGFEWVYSCAGKW